MAEQIRCEKCGWKYGGFHICIDPSKPEPAPIQGSMSAAQRAAIRETMQERWAQKREDERPRDEMIAQRYKDGGIGLIGLSKEFGISKSTVLRILKEFEAEGYLKMRRPSHTLAKGAK